ncbi:MAG TPA: glycoside hydrolase family 57 protein [Candidatus Limnocylindrales bacterium]|nr:glycoside hydrolase family 57 protein [Candidatus Limnocylindrales bacterium]
MPDVCFYFQVHQPYRLRRYSVFEVGRSQAYFDDETNEAVLRKVAEKCYRPMNALLAELIDRHEGRFKVAFSLTGTVLEQLERWAPDVLASFQRLHASGCVELLAETYHHSLSFLTDAEEFDYQVDLHTDRIQDLFGVRPRIFRNTELIFSNVLALHLQRRGFAGAIAEGADHVLGWRSPHFLYHATGARDLPLLLKSYRLSDDIAFRFGNSDWDAHPLSAQRFASWLRAAGGGGGIVNLFMDYETFGEHQWKETGIFEFMRELPGHVLAHPEGRLVTPSEAIAAHQPVAEIDVPTFMSWADAERDLSAWTGNAMQRSALEAVFALRASVLWSGDARLATAWRRLTTSDHFYYMCTKHFADGDVHKYFSPYESPYEAYIAFMNAVSDLRGRVRPRQRPWSGGVETDEAGLHLRSTSPA